MGAVTVKGVVTKDEDKDGDKNMADHHDDDSDNEVDEAKQSVEVIGTLNKDNIGPNTNTGQRFFKGGFMSAVNRQERRGEEDCIDV